LLRFLGSILLIVTAYVLLRKQHPNCDTYQPLMDGNEIEAIQAVLEVLFYAV